MNLKRLLSSALLLALLAPVTVLGQFRGTAPGATWFETDQTLPAGLWRWRLSGNTYELIKNEATAGDFSSITTPISISGTLSATWTTTQVLYPNGSVSLPSIAGSNFATTGLYWAAGPVLNIGVDGTLAATFDQNQDVTLAASVSVPATEKALLDGLAGHSYLTEISADLVGIFAGAEEIIRLGDSGTAGVTFNNGLTDMDFAIGDNTIANAFRIDAGVGNVFIHDTTNANNTQGLTVNQLAADDQAFTLKSSDIVTALTTVPVTFDVETDDYIAIGKRHATEGGTVVASMAISSGSRPVYQIETYGDGANTGKDTTAEGIVNWILRDHNGANALADIGADSNLFAIQARIGGSVTTRLLLDEDSELYVEGLRPFTDNNNTIGTSTERYLEVFTVALSNDDSATIAVTGGFTIAGNVLFDDETRDIGTTSIGLNDLHFGSGGIINWDGGDVTLTHSAGALTFGGDGAVGIDFNNHEMTNVDIDSGAIDGTTIGAASTTTIVGTTIDATTDFTIGSTVITDGVITDATGISFVGAVVSSAGTSYTPLAVTAVSAGAAVAVTARVVHITTNGDSDLDNLTLADGVDGQIMTFAVVAVGNAADSVKITPASMIGGTIITFAADPLGLGCVMQYDAGADGWTVVGNNGGTVS